MNGGNFDLNIENKVGFTALFRAGAFNLLFVILCVFLANSVSAYLFTTTEVRQNSMLHSFNDGDFVLIYRTNNPNYFKFGDVVVFRKYDKGAQTGDDKDDYLIKRIIGLPGDIINIVWCEEDNVCYVERNGTLLKNEVYTDRKYPQIPFDPKRPYGANDARPKPTPESDPVLNHGTPIPAGHFYYLGDNRGGSLDSQNAGQLGKFENIAGRVILRYQGISFFERIKRVDYQSVI
ncbi:MAG: signal peptidase I [Firmicutes bacterium]|nr:signal peptidase I [Bacillota bacterium]